MTSKCIIGMTLIRTNGNGYSLNTVCLSKLYCLLIVHCITYTPDYKFMHACICTLYMCAPVDGERETDRQRTRNAYIYWNVSCRKYQEIIYLYTNTQYIFATNSINKTKTKMAGAYITLVYNGALSN